MNTPLLIAAVVFLLLSFLVGPIKQSPPEPKPGDRRIVKRDDGKYVIERYQAYPVWLEIGRVPGYETLQRAREVKAMMENPIPEPTVIPDK